MRIEMIHEAMHTRDSKADRFIAICVPINV